jgi:hypothetical protein
MIALTNSSKSSGASPISRSGKGILGGAKAIPNPGIKGGGGGVDEEFPVRVKTGTVPGCSNSAPPMGTISGGHTYSMSVTAGADIVLISSDL